MDFPGIAKAALLIAYDNGGINRHRTEREARDDLEKFLASQPNEILPAIDAWLLSLPADSLELVCAGDQNEADKIMISAPLFTDKLLNDYFEQVC